MWRRGMVSVRIDNRGGTDAPQLRSAYYDRVCRARSKAIDQFAAEQSRIHGWINLRDVAGRCCLTADPTLPTATRNELFVNTLRALLDSALAGEFLIDGHSRLFRAHPKYRIRQRWLRNPDEAPAEAFVTQEELRGFLGVVDPTIYTKVSQFFIPWCWIPRALAVSWLSSRRPAISVPSTWLVTVTGSSESFWPLPPQEPKQKGPAIAHRIMKAKYRDGCV